MMIALNMDMVQAALAAGMLVICAAVLTQWRSVSRLRTVLQRDLARIFEQIDLLRFDNQQDESAAPHDTAATVTMPVPTLVPAIARAPRSAFALQGEDYAAALELAARGADQREIIARCGLNPAEARILVAMHGSAARRNTTH